MSEDHEGFLFPDFLHSLRMSYSATVFEHGSSDPLQGSFNGLSLTDFRETRAGEREPSRLNPFEAFISPASETTGDLGRNPLQSVEDLTREVIPGHLRELQQPRRFTLDENDALYAQGRQFQRKWSVSEEGFLNWKALLSGWFEFPAVMLLNPSSWDHLEFDEMEEMSTTLTWLREMLAQVKLGLDDVIIFDMFPMLRDELRDDVMKRMGPAKRDELARESFALTKASLAIIRPRVLISCQCCTKPTNERWGFFQDALALNLCSSVAESQSERVRVVDVSAHQMQVVQGMHPQYVVQRQRDLEEVLAGLFRRVFGPFGMWQSRRVATQQGLQDAGAMLLGLVALLRLQVQRYERLCAQAEGSGVDGPVAVRRVKELGAQLAVWERESNEEVA